MSDEVAKPNYSIIQSLEDKIQRKILTSPFGAKKFSKHVKLNLIILHRIDAQSLKIKCSRVCNRRDLPF